MGPWFVRFRHYPGSVIGHILWGALAGAVGYEQPVNGMCILSGGYAYQFGSAWRKMRARQRAIEAGKTPDENSGLDTVGLDAFDYAVGYAIGYALRRLLS